VPAVLLIDDDPAVLGSLTMLLETAGFRVLTARDGVQGLRAFRKHSPAVVVTDILMPEKDGIGLIMQMRRERPKVKVIAISGGGRVGNSDFLTVAGKLGADTAMPKPIDTDKLVDTIRHYLALGD
jgi:DNA-binding NtrC family response regulator